MAESLPVVAVSAANQETAMAFIDDLVGEDGEARESSSRVWCVNTTYYRARLRLTAHGDSDEALPPVEAHVVILDENECSSPSWLQARAKSVNTNKDGVLVAVSRTTQSPSVESAALALHYELVPLTEPEDPEEPWGLKAVCSSLQAHLWPNLERVHDPSQTHNGLDLGLDTSDHSDSDPEEMLARCEQFADALVAVQGARETPLSDEQWAEGREQRLRRAEDLLASITRTMR